MNRRRALTAAVSPLLAAGTILASAPPASATGTPVLANANIAISFPTSTTFNVCATGWVEGGTVVVGEWAFAIQGVRADDGSLIDFEATGSGPTFGPACETISTNGTKAGSFVASLHFIGDGSSLAATDGIGNANIPEVVANAVYDAQWTPQQGVVGVNT